MARLILSSGEAVGLSSGTYTVFGTATGSETVSFGETAAVTFDASFNAGGDTIVLAGNAADYTVVRSGSQVILTNASGGSFTIPVGTAGATISFDDGDRTLAFNSVAGQIELGDQAVTSTAAAVTAGSGAAAAADPDSFPLTAGIDAGNAFAGGDGVTTYFANDTTLTLGDNLDGGEGSDVLSLVSAAATAFAGFTTTSVEQYSIQPLVTGASLAVNSASSGLNDINIHDTNGTIAAFTLTGVGLGTSVTVDTAIITALNLGFAAAAGASDAVTVNLSGVSGTTVDVTSAGVETVNLATSGTASTLAALANTTGATTLGVSGSANLTITGALDAAMQTVSAGGFNGDLSLVLGLDAAPNAAVAGVDVVDTTVTTGAGDDILDLSNATADVELNVATGSGDDQVTLGAALENAGAATAGDTLNGGAGDADVLIGDIDLFDAVAVTTALTGVTGFEVLSVSGSTAADVVTLTDISADINTLRVTDAVNAGGLTVNGASGSTLELNAASGGAVAVAVAGTGTSDTFNIANTAAAGNILAGQAISATGVETLTLDTGTYATAAAQTVSTVGVGTGALVVTGGNALTTTGSITAATINASASGALTMGAAATSVTTITGSAFDDTLLGDASSTINAGSGDDIVTGGTGNDVLNGDDGDDVITMNTGVDNVDGGAGADTIIAGANITSADTINGGAGNDTLQLTAGSIAAAQATGISGIEFLNYDAAGAVALSADETGLTGLIGVIADTGGNAFTGATAGLDLYFNANTAASSWSLTDATGANDVVDVVLSSAATIAVAATTIADVETINIASIDVTLSAAGTGNNVNTMVLTAADATTVNVTGNTELQLTTTGSAIIETVSAAGMSIGATEAGLTYVGTNTVIGGVSTITGSGGVDNLTGSAGTIDTINGGAGADTLVYLTGSTTIDTFNGGAGADTFDLNSVGSLVAHAVLGDVEVGDAIDFADIDTAAAANGTLGAAVQLGAAATLAQYLDAAAVGDGTAAAAGALVNWFQFGGDTYLVIDNTAGATFAATDSVTVISGLVDLTDAVIDTSVLTIA